MTTARVAIVAFALANCLLATATRTRKCIYDCSNQRDTSISNQDRSLDAAAAITEEEMRRELLRLEGRRILEKLRMDKPPDVRVSLRDLPFPIKQTVNENSFVDETAVVESNEDAPGRLKTVYIVGKKPRHGRGRTHLCTDQNSKSAVCIEFELNSGRPLPFDQLSSATLCFQLHLNAEESETYVSESNSLSLNLSVSGLRHGHEQIIVANIPTIATRSGTWINVNVSDYVRQEMLGHTRPRHITLVIGCGDNFDCLQPPPIAVSQNGSRRPFLVLELRRAEFDQPDVRRKRSRMCGPSSTSESECCLETLYVNFTEIGWDSWILQPRGYETGYCKGRCQSTATRNYNAILRAVLQRRMNPSQQQQLNPSNAPDPEMAPCCSPLRMMPLEILYAKIENSHEQLSTAVLPSMIVDSCKC